MRLLAALIFLLTPLRGVAAAALCVSAEHGNGIACETGMTDMGEHGDDMGPDLAATPDGPIGCESGGLCAAAASSIVGSIAELPLEHLADAGPASFAPLLGPGTRPAPPIHPPRA